MSTPKQAFAERLNDALDNIRFPALGKGRLSRLAEIIGSSQQETDRWLKGVAFPPTSALVKLAELTQTRSNWLLSGHGAPYEPGRHPRGAGKLAPATGKEKLSKEALELGLKWMKLPRQQRQAIARVVEELVGEED